VVRFGELWYAIESMTRLIYTERNVHDQEYLGFLRDLARPGVGWAPLGCKTTGTRTSGFI